MKPVLLVAASMACLCACYVRNRVYNAVPQSIVAVAPAPAPAQKAASNKQPKPDAPDHVDADCDPSLRACLAFVEFDEMGEPWDPRQLPAALKLIDAAKKKSDHPIVVTFTHGWKNNAEDEHLLGKQNGNVVGFEGVLEFLKQAKDPNTKEPLYADSPVVGIYLSWRGDLISKYWPVRRQLSYFNREGAAIRIPGAAMTAAFTSIMLESHRGKPGAHVILVGHSFGGLVLERALTQAMTDFVLRRPPPGSEDPADPIWADLVVFVNSAAAASEGKQMLDLLNATHAEYTTPVREGRAVERPLFLSISSLGDAATRFALPIGHGPSYLSRAWQGSWRTYNPPDAFGIASQSSYYLSTTAHMEALQSHLIVAEADAAQCNGGKLFAGPFQLPNQQRYRICEKPGRHNDTPYWAMEMPASIVPDHGGIFNENFIGLLQLFLPDAEEMRNRALRPALRTRP
ncbi:MAG TPA: hypothetical protein VGR73_11820 [Bryobacteraceae bacterium]|nr:hypothetical protein [Bryobacteraceae bacterium]